jgi:hypothetical protein
MAKRSNMSAKEYRAALDKLKLNQTTAAKFFRIPVRTSARWAERGVPRWPSVCIRAHLAGRITEEELRGKLIEDRSGEIGPRAD